MKTIISAIFGAILGGFITLAYVRTNDYAIEYTPVENRIDYKQLFSYSNVNIPPKQHMCEESVGYSVGDVVELILQASSESYVNRISQRCDKQDCRLVYSSCAPWQRDGCGSTSLMFSMKKNGEIDTASFRCLQMP